MIISKIKNAVHALCLQFDLPESMEETLIDVCIDGVRGNDNLCKNLTDHPHAEDNMRFYVLRTALLKRIFFVDTPLGKLKVYSKHETDTPDDFPGAFVDFVTPACPEGDMLACVEYDSNDKLLQTCVYQPGFDSPVEVVKHKKPNQARIETDENEKLHYYDKNGNEIYHGMTIRFDDDTETIVYRSDDDKIGVDVTNPVLIELGKAQPCQYGIIPLTEDDLKEIIVI